MAILTIHNQQVPGWVQNWVRDTSAGWVKGIDNFPNFFGVKTIGRTFMPDHESNGLVWKGASGAEQWFSRWLPVYQANPHVFAWEGPNEPHPMYEQAFRTKLDEFTTRLAILMTNSGYRLVGMNWSVGWPDIGHAPEFASSISTLAMNGHYLGLHEYAAPEMWNGDGYWTLRYRNTVNELVSAGIQIPFILITECGIDGGVIGQPKRGWKTYATMDQYVQQLAWYESELRKDPYVLSATIFTAGPYIDWMDFEVTEELAEKLKQALGGISPVPNYSIGIDVSDWQGDINHRAVSDDGYDFALVRASVCRSDGSVVVDGKFSQNWQGFKDQNMPRGAYHYLGVEATGQAAFFVNTVSNDLPEIGYFGDLEHGGLTSERCQLFLEAVDRNLNDRGINQMCDVYSRASFLNNMGLSLPWANGRKLWVSSPGRPEPVMPASWNDWLFWQFGQRNINGIDGPVDVNNYQGTTLELLCNYL